MLKRLLSLAVLSFGCASAPVGTPPTGAASGDTGWKLYRTAHLQLVTNVSDPDARMGVQVLEELRAIALAALWPNHPAASTATLNVVCPANGVDLDWTFGVSTTRYPHTAFFQDQPTPRIVIWGPPASWSYRSGAEPHSWVFIPMKGVVWQLGRQLDPRAPPWLLLGLGENLVPFAHHEESGRVGLGEVNSTAFSRYWSTRAYSIPGDVMSWDGRAESSGAAGYAAYEGAAWALVHWMSKKHPADFEKFRAAIQRGLPPTQPGRGRSPRRRSMESTRRSGPICGSRTGDSGGSRSGPFRQCRSESGASARRSSPSCARSSPRARRVPSRPCAETDPAQ